VRKTAEYLEGEGSPNPRDSLLGSTEKGRKAGPEKKGAGVPARCRESGEPDSWVPSTKREGKKEHPLKQQERYIWSVRKKKRARNGLQVGERKLL